MRCYTQQFFIFVSHHLGSSFLSSNIVSRTNARMRYWSQFSSHEIQTVRGIKWYISNILVRCGFIASIDEAAKCNNYINNEATRIYQSCYQDTKYCSFTIKDYEGHSNLNGLKGIISSYDSIRHQYNIIIKRNQDLTLPEYRCALSPGVLEPTNLLRKELNWSTYHLSRGSKNNESKVIQLNMPHETIENESMILTTNLSTDWQSILKFRYATFELMRRRFPRPEQTTNGISDKSLMKELDREEHADGVALDSLKIDQMKHSDAYVSMTMRHIHRQDQPKRKRLRTHKTCSTMMRIDQINAVRQAEREHRVKINKMTPPKTTDSDYFKFDMPFVVSDKSLHTAGAGLNEFDLIKGQRCTLLEIDDTIIKEFSREQIIICNDFSFESLNPGKEIDDNVCDLCLKW